MESSHAFLHQPLESARGIRYPLRHTVELPESQRHDKSGLSFVSFIHLDLVVSGLQIEHGEPFGSCQSRKSFLQIG